MDPTRPLPSPARRLLLRGLGRAGATLGLLALARPSGALSREPLRFPRDHGAHPDARIEWWYVTGLLTPARAAAPSHGFQLTFFRLRRPLKAALQARDFAPDQLLLAHAALSDLARQRLVHDQRLARLAGSGLARADERDTRLRLGDWTLERDALAGGLSRYRLALRSDAADFALRLTLDAPQAPLLQGDAGWSRKGPGPAQASRYISEPQLRGAGQLVTPGQAARERPVQALAWLDHEWSDELLGGAADKTQRAQGWDWLGINLHDGSALTLFRLRHADGRVLWSGGSWREADGRSEDLQQHVRLEPLAHWQSPLSLARYPVRWQLRTPRGDFLLQALFEAQEVDARRSSGLLYWEGAARLSTPDGRELGLGYLEMTGYAERVPL